MKDNLKKENPESKSEKKQANTTKDKKTSTANKHEQGSDEKVSKHPTKEVNEEG